MATTNETTLAMRDIGLVETERYVNTPGRGIGATRAVKVKRLFPQQEIGRVVHQGGPRDGRFSPPTNKRGAAARAVKRELKGVA